MRSRIVIILSLITALWVILIMRAAFLQILPNNRLKALQKRQFETSVTLNPRRGDILDRNGHELAVSMTTYSLFADPKVLTDVRKTARLLAGALNIPVRQIEEKIRNKKKRFVWIERKISKSVRDGIQELNIHGLGFIEESQRIYPNDRLLSHVLGFIGAEGQGLEGLELKYNEQLQATSKRVSLHRDAHGRPLIVNGQVFNQVPDGSDIQLTIDRELQFMLEQELGQTIREHEADSAVGVILDAQTSEILAMANSLTFDPNHSSDYPIERKRNRVVADSFEPGSTMKTFVVAGALAKGLVEPNSKFDCEGGLLRIGKRVIREADSKHRFGVLTVSEILALSSNVGTTKIAQKLGDDNLRDVLNKFGFGEKSGVDLPGEARGILHPTPWHDHLLANISFGHGISTTPLQIANAYAAIANGGILHQPFLVKAIRDHESGEVSEIKPKNIRRVLGEDQVAKMRIMLAAVTSDYGTGASARVAGFPVAGKTGTAQKVNPSGRGYLRGGYISSFAGFLPANDPKFVIYVAVDHPRKGYYGAAVAAPVFSKIARFAVRRAGLAPVLISESNVVPTAKRGSSHVPQNAKPIEEIVSQRLSSRAALIPNSKASAVRNSIALSNSVSNAAVKQGHVGSLATRQAAAPMGLVVPDLEGLTLREVLERITGTEINIRIHGQGFVKKTNPSSGTRLAENKELTVFLE